MRKRPTIRSTWALSALLLGGASLPCLGCSISAGGIAFAPINPIDNASVDSVGSLLVECPENTPYTISLSSGEGSYQQRVLRSGNNTLQYNLFLDVNRQQLWGDGSGATVLLSAIAGAQPASHPVYARIPAQPLAHVGLYSDAILVIVEF